MKSQHLSIVELAESAETRTGTSVQGRSDPATSVRPRRSARDALDELTGGVGRLCTLLERRGVVSQDWSTGGYEAPRSSRYDAAFGLAAQQATGRDQEEARRQAREETDWARRRREDEVASVVARQRIEVLRARAGAQEEALRSLRSQVDAPVPVGQALARREVLGGAAALVGVGGALAAWIPRAPRPRSLPGAAEVGESPDAFVNIAIAIGAVAAVAAVGVAAHDVGSSLVLADRRTAVTKGEADLWETRMALAALAPW